MLRILSSGDDASFDFIRDLNKLQLFKKKLTPELNRNWFYSELLFEFWGKHISS